MIREISDSLIDAVDTAAPAWVRHCVARYVPQPWAPEFAVVVDDAGEACRSAVVGRLGELLALDIGEQPTTPLVILRSAHAWPTAVLSAQGVTPPRRDPFDERVDPDDIYDIAPKAWADFGEQVGEAGLMWGAAKAHLHLQRRAERDAQEPDC